MIKHRCPWCGEYLPMKFPIRDVIWSSNKPDTCPHCKKPYTMHANFTSAIVLLIGLIAAYTLAAVLDRFNNKEIIQSILIGAGCILLLVIIWGTYQLPYDRAINKNELLDNIPKKYVFAEVIWKRRNENGLFMPRIQMKNGEIFPTCFFDANGTLLSTPYCAVLENIRWKRCRCCICKISLVLDEAPKDNLLVTSNTFFLYHNHRCIATGTIR